MINKIKKSKTVILQKKDVKKIGIYSPWFDRFAGGGEKVTAYFALYFEEKFPDADIEIILDDMLGKIVERPATLDEVYQKYGVKLKRTVFKQYFHDYKNLFHLNYINNYLETTSNFDIFVNCFMNLSPSLGSLNFHYVHFPMPYSSRLSNFLFDTYIGSYHTFITYSEFTSYWTKERLKVNNTQIIYPPIEIPNLTAVPEKSNIILTVSRLSLEKKIESLIDTFQQNEEQFAEYEFHIAGSLNPKNESYYEQLNAMITSNKIKFFPNISSDDLIIKYKESKFYWNAMGYGYSRDSDPFQFEHFGLTVAEALSYGVVPIVIDNGGPAEIVKKGNCGLTWFTKEELFEQTKKLMNDSELLSLYQKKALNYVSNFSKETFFKEFDRILEAAL